MLQQRVQDDRQGRQGKLLQPETGQHKGHAGDNGTGESHFRVEMASERFVDMSRIDRQRAVYGALEAELSSGAIHALALKLSDVKD